MATETRGEDSFDLVIDHLRRAEGELRAVATRAGRGPAGLTFSALATQVYLARLAVTGAATGQAAPVGVAP